MNLFEFLILTGTLSFLLFAIAIVCFIRISGKHIEHEMKKKGIALPCWDGVMGIRFGMYAIAIVRNSISPMSMVDDASILRFARKKDRYLAMFYVISGAIFLTIISISYFLYGP
ncbi:hypothetical protein SG34_008750 [Thalassomonas viridans]|uniref:Uncharacterized protein n=1 Tax=Thalassomonas viridans TaxID=137584 RepID=A0AAF0CB58_9GAMM|nr:hypothetical protein [Thalassomonas viridans]WDE06960.1 hypothetical protein SG34_008750 [Thalassomonas viridans]